MRGFVRSLIKWRAEHRYFIAGYRGKVSGIPGSTVLRCSVGFAELDHVGHEIVEFFRRDLVFIEARHGSEAEAHLGFHEEYRGRLVIQSGSEARLTAGMALIAIFVKDQLAAGYFVIGNRYRTCDWFAAPG